MDNRQSVNYILEEAPKTIPVETLRTLAFNAPKSVCFVDTENSSGSAGLYLFKGIAGQHNCLISCHHVLPPEQVFNKKTLFNFEGSEKFSIQPEWVAQIYSKPQESGDFTVVELTQVAIDHLISQGAVFLNISWPRVDDQFVIFQYPNEKLSFGHGSIQAIDSFTLGYYAASDFGSSGSALILWNGDAIGIHRGRLNPIQHKSFGNMKVATSIQYIRDVIFAEQSSNSFDKQSAFAFNSPAQLLRALPHEPRLRLVWRIQKHCLIRTGEKDPDIWGMSYNSARDELFVADWHNDVVRATRLHEHTSDLCDVYRGNVHETTPPLNTVCYMSDSDTLLVCSNECSDNHSLNVANWLVALSRSITGSEWREKHRVKTGGMGVLCCALSDSRVLVGLHSLECMELFCVKRGPLIVRIGRVHAPEEYTWFCATSGRDSLVAMSFKKDQSVRVYRLIGSRLNELARIHLKKPNHLLWLNNDNRLLAIEFERHTKSRAIVELKLINNSQLERCRIVDPINCGLSMWCSINNGLVLCHRRSGEILHYSFY